MTEEVFTAAYSIEHSQMRIAKSLSKMKEASLCLAKYRVNHGLDAIDPETFDKKWQNLQAEFYKALENCVAETSGVEVMSCTKCGACSLMTHKHQSMYWMVAKIYFVKIALIKYFLHRVVGMSTLFVLRFNQLKIIILVL